jgi:hypothetical protein
MLASLLLFACASSGDDTGSGDPCRPAASSSDTPTLRIGHGDSVFEALSGDDTQTELIHGPQGGVHTNLALEATYLDPNLVWHAVLDGVIDGERVGHTEPLAAMRCNRSTETLQTVGLLLIWDAEPEEVHGKTAQVNALVTDAAGTTQSAQASFFIHDPSLE